MKEVRLRDGLLRLALVIVVGFATLIGIIAGTVAIHVWAGMGAGLLCMAAACVPYSIFMMGAVGWTVGEDPIALLRDEWGEIKRIW